MKQLITVLIILSFAAPVHAQLPSGFEPVEKKLIEKQMLEEQMTRDMQKQQPEAPKLEQKKGSSWWKWALGIVVVGGIAAAAGKGSGGGGNSSGGNTGGGGGGTPTPTTGSTKVSW